MRKIIIIMVLFIGLSYQQCRIGCQKCTSADICVLCDIINNYFLNATTCQLSNQQNCKILSLSGNCTVCNPGFFVDQTTRRCVSVATSNVVANCLSYSATQTCTLCGTGRFLSANQCVAATTLITNCNYYSENGKCLMCTTGYIFTHTLDTCSKIPNNLNCLTYTHVNCTTCSPGFVYNRNNEAFTLLTADGGYNLLTQLIEGSTLWGDLNVCQSTAATNCEQQNLFNQCISCKPGFFLKDKLCVAYPINPIFGCAVYSSLTTCTSCVEFMYPTTPSTCVNNTIIENCAKYSSSSSTNVCTECSRNYFLNANTCSLRTVSLAIVNCITFNKNVDNCDACSVGTVLTTDKLACLPAVNNCKAYAASTVSTPFAVCSLCNDGWYINIVGNSVVCVQGTIANCILYLNGGSNNVNNTCTTCANGFYLANKVCTAHTVLTNCMTYSQVEANVCTACNTGSYPFHLTTTCVPTTVISSCALYSVDGLICEKCMTGFYFVGNTCVAIPAAFTNCEIFDGVRCVKCNAGFMVNDVNPAGTCIKLPDYLVSDANNFCFSTAVPATTQVPVWNEFLVSATNNFYPLVCQSCATGTFPRLTLPNEAICVKDSEISLYRGFGPRDVNCKRYVLSYGSKELVCGECVTNYFISNYHLLAHLSSAKNSFHPSGITCVSSCTLTVSATATDTNMIILDDLLGFVNICIPANTAAGYITNDSTTGAHLRGCTRAARINFTKLPTTITAGIFNSHFKCISTFATSAAQLKANFKYGLVVTKAFNPATAFGTLTTVMNTRFDTYNALSSSATPFKATNTDATVKYDWEQAYPNTDTGPYPSVFNYKGILFEAQVEEITTSATNLVASYDNCDIFYKFISGEGIGLAFTNVVSLLFNIRNPISVTFICLRCAFGFSLGFYNTPTAAANNPPFPSCNTVRMTNCASNAIYGGLTTFLNSVFSCHHCATGTYPHIYIETDYTAANPNEITSSSKFAGWRLLGAYSSATAIDATKRASFDCVSVASTATIGKPTVAAPTTTDTFANFKCAAFAEITPMTARGVGTVLANRYCLACAANHFPTYARDNSNTEFTIIGGYPGWVVNACTASPNCDATVTTQFNGCGKCRTDTELASSPTFFAFYDVLLAGCVQVFSKNCFLAQNLEGVLQPTTGAIYYCHVCKAGFFMNVDHICEAVKLPNMVDTATFAIPSFAGYVWDSSRANYKFRDDGYIPDHKVGNTRLTNQLRIHYLLSASGNPYGVSACKSGWSQAPASHWAASICIDSPYLRGSVRTTNPATKFIANCLRYRHRNTDDNNFIYNYPIETGEGADARKYLCDQCNVGFNLHTNAETCVAQGTVTNCYQFLGDGSTPCSICNKDFFNVNGVCVGTPIPNCKTHKQTTAHSADAALECTTCNDGFSRATNKLSCTIGTIPFCTTYTDGSTTDCLTCNTGYSLLSATDPQNSNASFKYCYPIPTSSNCGIWQGVAHNSGINQATFSCSRCNSTASAAYGLRSYDYLPLLIPPSSCLAFNPIANCIAFYQNETVVTRNTFKCYQCSNAYWLQTSSNTCQLRVNNQAECTAVPLTADTCTTCKAGWYLNGDSTRCIINPPGIAGCAIYSDVNVCTLCMPGFYLNLDHRCIPSTLVPNCKVYSGNWTCTACADGWLLFNATTCSVPNATNCKEVATANSCRTCPTGFGFSTVNGVTSCVSNALLNCATATTVSPFACLVCNTGFYPGTNGTCLAVNTTIVGCIVYDSPNTCLTCQKVGILSVNKTSCDATKYLIYMDGNCQASYLTAAPACSQCALGSFFSGEACTLCPNNGLSFGCLSCDPANPTTCFLCSSGFYMNRAGICIRNTNLPDGTPTDGVPAPPTSSVKKAMAFTLGLAALYFEGL